MNAVSAPRGGAPSDAVMPVLSDEVYTPREIAGLFKLARATVYGAIGKGTLRAFKVGSQFRMTRMAIVEWLGLNLADVLPIAELRRRARQAPRLRAV